MFASALRVHIGLRTSLSPHLFVYSLNLSISQKNTPPSNLESGAKDLVRSIRYVSTAICLYLPLDRYRD